VHGAAAIGGQHLRIGAIAEAGNLTVRAGGERPGKWLQERGRAIGGQGAAANGDQIGGVRDQAAFGRQEA